MTNSELWSGSSEPSPDFQPPIGPCVEGQLDHASDAELGELVAERIAVPKVAAADSFVLHAPLELFARMTLLSLVPPAMRDAARARIAWLGETYDAAGAPVEEAAPRDHADPLRAQTHLLAAIEAEELDDADAAAAWLAANVSPSALVRALADDVVPRLAAAAHGSIFLQQLPRIASAGASYARMLRGLVRELAREHAWKLTWQRERGSGETRTDDLVARLRRPPSPGDPGSNFIYPIMSLVERSGLAAELLDAPTRDLDPERASRVLARVAACSMLQDDPDQAPYGWTHCLSMPQAVLSIAPSCSDPQAAVAVAATYVLGFRATLGKVEIDLDWTPEPPRSADAIAGLAASPGEAAAAVWHAAPQLRSRIVATLASRAAVHEDAHLAKYTVACFDAARADPHASHVHLAAAAYLSAWWGARGDGHRALASRSAQVSGGVASRARGSTGAVRRLENALEEDRPQL